MSTLLLRLAGPMQSWGTQSRFSIRDGATEPSKSGVVGLLCAALGRPRTQPVDDLAALMMGVRVDLPGVPRVDFQTAGGASRVGDTYGVAKADGSRGDTVISRRHYLADADFLVGLEGDTELVDTLARAVEQPHWPLFLGRKSYVPAARVLVGIQSTDDLRTALQSEPWPGLHRADISRLRRLMEFEQVDHRLRVVLEVPDGSGENVRSDQPVGAAFETRIFALRSLTTTFFEVGREVRLREDNVDVPIETDPQSS